MQVRNYSQLTSNQSKWLPGTILQDTGPISARVEVTDGTVVRCHQDQLHARPVTTTLPGFVDDFTTDVDAGENVLPKQSSTAGEKIAQDKLSTPEIPRTEDSGRRYSVRDRRPPQYLKDYVQ